MALANITYNCAALFLSQMYGLCMLQIYFLIEHHCKAKSGLTKMLQNSLHLLEDDWSLQQPFSKSEFESLNWKLTDKVIKLSLTCVVFVVLDVLTSDWEFSLNIAGGETW